MVHFVKLNKKKHTLMVVTQNFGMSRISCMCDNSTKQLIANVGGPQSCKVTAADDSRKIDPVTWGRNLSWYTSTGKIPQEHVISTMARGTMDSLCTPHYIWTSNISNCWVDTYWFVDTREKTEHLREKWKLEQLLKMKWSYRAYTVGRNVWIKGLEQAFSTCLLYTSRCV